MKFVQYFQKSAISDALVETCGDRDVIILDGRQGAITHEAIAREEGLKRGWLAFQLRSGESFNRSVINLTDIILIKRE